MHKKLLFCLLFLVTACKDMGGSGPLDAQTFLSSLDGPQIPTVQDTQFEAAKSAEKQGDFEQAAAAYQFILTKSPDNKDAMLGMADSYRRSGAYDKAISIYDQLLSKSPDMVGAKEGKGLALMGKGDFDTPPELFEEVLKIDPKRWKTLNALGILFTTRNMQPEAQQYFAAALQQSPSNPSILNNLGLSQALNRNFAAGIGSLQQASAITAAGSPERKRVDLNLALVYAISGKLDNAKAIAENYLTGAALDNNLGLYAHLAKDDQMAKTYLNMALTDSKTFYEKAWNNLQTINDNSDATAPTAGPTPGHPMQTPSGGEVRLQGEDNENSEQILKKPSESR